MTLTDMSYEDQAAKMLDAVRAERDDLRQVGDYMQSEASRLAEWAEQHAEDMPYEVYQGLLGVNHAVRRWTEIRKAAA